MNHLSFILPCYVFTAGKQSNFIFTLSNTILSHNFHSVTLFLQMLSIYSVSLYLSTNIKCLQCGSYLRYKNETNYITTWFL